MTLEETVCLLTLNTQTGRLTTGLHMHYQKFATSFGFYFKSIGEGGTWEMFGKGEVFWGNVAADWMEVQFVLFTVVEKTMKPSNLTRQANKKWKILEFVV